MFATGMNGSCLFRNSVSGYGGNDDDICDVCLGTDEFVECPFGMSREQCYRELQAEEAGRYGDE